MAKPNYSYEKRQKELAKKAKKDEKLKRKQGRADPGAAAPVETTVAPDPDKAPH